MNNRRRLVGVVTSNKMQKTVVVQIPSTYQHALYKKIVHSHKKVMAHDDGFNSQRIKLISFIVSGVYGGVPGALFAIHTRHIPTDLLYWTMNGEVIFVSIVGGVDTFFGPIVGSAFFLLIHDYLQIIIFTRWELIVGMILIFFILFFKEGIVGSIENRVASNREKKAAGSARGQGGGS